MSSLVMLFPHSQYLFDDLRRDEGLKLLAYPDPLSGAEPFTIGYGHTGREVHPGLGWTLQQAEDALNADILAVRTGLASAIPWGFSLEPIRADCLINMAFNMGVRGLLQFDTFLSLMRKGLYAAASDDLRDHTLWAKQVKSRAVRIEAQIKTGVHQS